MHVPEANLPRYRALKRIADQFDNLGNSLSNIGEYAQANKAWRQRSSWNARAQELRAPAKPKLEGEFKPCTTQCGQPEPCFGCDSGDYVDA